MIPYIDYEYYSNNFGGNLIPCNSLKKQAREASRKINYFTQNRIVDIDNNVKYATCLIAELLYNQEILKSKIINDDNNKQIASETVGPRSVTYINNSQYQNTQVKSAKELNSSIYQICKENLDEELLFRGI